MTVVEPLEDIEPCKRCGKPLRRYEQWQLIRVPPEDVTRSEAWTVCEECYSLLRSG